MSIASQVHSMDSPGRTVLVVNDSPVARAIIDGVIQAEGSYRVLGQATNGREGIEMAAHLKPAVVVLDMHMPDMNGIDVTREIMRRSPTRILICSATITRNARYLFQALDAGALDYVKTPALKAPPGASVGRQELRDAGRQLHHKLDTILGVPLKLARTQHQRYREQPLSPIKTTPAGKLPPILAIGCSTGGPTTLSTVLGGLPVGLPAAVLVSQHIERDFTGGMADWLKKETGHAVEVGQNRTQPKAGRVYLAPGGRFNMTLGSSGLLRIEPAVDVIYAPNIDAMMHSVADTCGKHSCGMILTGLGDDGARGMLAIHKAGGHTLVQAPDSAVIPSMPESVIALGAAPHGYSPRSLSAQVVRWLEKLA